MILLHAMEAPYAIPAIGIVRGDTMFHLLSDLPGAAGTAELLAFARAIGGRDAWIQGAGTYREHFDIFGEWAERALAYGACPATGSEVAVVLARKRAQIADARQPVPVISANQRRALEDLARRSGLGAGHLASFEATRLFELASRMLGMQREGVAPGTPAHVVVLLGTPERIEIARVAIGLLADAGARVTLMIIADSPPARWWAEPQLMQPSSRRDLQICTEPNTIDLTTADLIVDLLQSWREEVRPLQPVAPTRIITEVTQLVNAAGRPVLSLDLPSGAVLSERGLQESGIRATATLATLLPLRELSFVAISPLLGEVWLGDVGIAPRICKRVGVRVGPLFERAPLVRLEGVPLGDGAITSDICRWVIADT